MIFRVLASCCAGLTLGLICNAPANKLLPRVIPSSAPLKLYEVSGTVLRGQAGFVEAAGIRGDKLMWSIKPASLLMGRLSADVVLGHGDEVRLVSDSATSAQGFVSYALSGKSFRLRDFSAQAPLSELQKAVKLSYMPVSGMAQLELEQLDADKIDDSSMLWPTTLNGSISLNDAVWKLGNAVPLGSINAQLSADESNNQIALTISDSKAANIDLRGQAQLKRDRSYAAQLQIKPKADTPSNLANQMKALGRTDKQGWYQINNNGKLPNF